MPTERAFRAWTEKNGFDLERPVFPPKSVVEPPEPLWSAGARRSSCARPERRRKVCVKRCARAKRAPREPKDRTNCPCCRR